MHIPGPRQKTEGIFRGEFEPLTVYLIGDTVTWEGVMYEALADFRSGFLDPATVIADIDDLWRKSEEPPE